MRNSTDILQNVLNIGPPFKNPRGGIAQVLNSYSKIIQPFNFISTTGGGNKLSNLFILMKSLLKYLYFLQFKGIEIIHIHSASNLSFSRKSLFVKLGKFFNKKVLLHLHGGLFEEFYHTNPKKITKTCNKADGIITVSKYFEEFVKNNKLNKLVFRLPNGIYLPSQIKREKPNDGSIQFLFLGTISEIKGIFDIIEVLGKNQDKLRGKIKLIVAGNGESDKLIDLISQYHIKDIVEYVGWADNDTKDRLLRNADVYIQPSHFESFGISILEAMSYGIPVIASNIGGIPDFVKNNETGILIKPKDQDGLLNAIKFVIENPNEAIEMGKKAKLIANDYTPDKIKHHLTNIYQQIINR